MLDFYRQLATILQREPLVLATVTRIQGSVPREIGAKMAVCAGGTIGTIGGGAGEAKVIAQAQRVLITGEKQWVELDLSGVHQRETQGVCGGIMQVWLERWQGNDAIALVHQITTLLQTGQAGFLVTPADPARSPYLALHSVMDALSPLAFTERLLPPPTLLLVGAGHIALPLAHLAHLVGFQVVVQDDRLEFANVERFPDAVSILTQPLEAAVERLDMTQLYAALVTRGYLYDRAALTVLLPRSPHYIGMIGSKKRILTVFQAIQQAGIPGIEPPLLEALLRTIHAPIGLDIAALTPEEIAVSICAELINVRRGGKGQSLAAQRSVFSSSALNSSMLAKTYGQAQQQ